MKTKGEAGMSAWKECKLGDVIELCYGKGLKETNRISGNIPVYGSNGIVGYHNQFLVKGPGIVIGRKGSVGEIKYSATNFFPIDTTYYVTLKPEHDMTFVYYFLLTMQLHEMNSHSAVPGLNRNDVYSLEVFIPPLSEQCAIAGVLSSLDDKIDLLHRQNKTLEAMAEALFRQWFVEEAEKGWEEKPLSNIAEHIKINVQPNKNSSTLYHHYSIPAFDERNSPVIEFGSEIQSNKYQIFPNTILISKLNPRFPRVWAIPSFIEDNSICSTEFQVISPHSQDWYGFIYCLLKSKQVTEELIGATGGTSGSHQRVKPEDILKLTFQVPGKKKLIDFNMITTDYWPKIEMNRKQIRTLEKLRDMLLPKLMSGEVRVAALPDGKER